MKQLQESEYAQGAESPMPHLRHSLGWTMKPLSAPDCGTREALESIGVDTAEQEQILESIHRSMNGGRSD